jgi:hypothetical protein
MKQLAMLRAAMLFLAVIPAAGWAQNTPPGQSLPPGQEENKRDHGSFGAFFDYSRLQTPSLNMFGAGGRMGFKLWRQVQLEAEISYDFKRSFTQSVTSGSSTNSVTTNVKGLYALFGPKVGIPHTKNFFFVAKAGFVNYGVSGASTTGSFTTQIAGIANGNIDVVFYPGAGAEFKIGKYLDIRAEAGDEIVSVNNGHLNNFRATIGPQFRF